MNIIVNGGTSGIGKEVVLFLSQDINNKIIASGRDEEAMKVISSVSPNIHAVKADLSLAGELSQTFPGKIRRHFTDVDVLINMAGTLVNKPFMILEEREARLMMETNFFAPAAIIKMIMPLMRKGSHILNISSMGGYQGSMKFSGLSVYSASKAAIACLSECLAEEFRDSGISVNCIALGAVRTAMFEKAFPGYKAPVEAGEIAPFIAYIALNGHRFMNGKIIPVAVNNP
jgi:NAD(P)-dependent dehydrogenase (short-subunit alcohol dehydrogenase family)